MTKKILLFFTFLLIIILATITYLSIFGVETTKFNKIISGKIIKNYPGVDLNLDKVKIIIKPFKFKIDVVTYKPQINIQEKSLKLKKISTTYNLVSFFNKDFGIKNLNLNSEYNEIKTVIKLFRSLSDSPQLLILDKITKEGKIYFEAKVKIDEQGNIGNNYIIKGEVKNFSVDLFNKQKITKINFKFDHIENRVNLNETNFKYQSIPISSDQVTIQKVNSNYLIRGNFKNLSSKIDKKILQNYFKNYNIKNIIFSSTNDFSFKINKKFKIKNLQFKSNIDLDNAEYFIDSKKLNNIFPNIEDKIIFRNNKIYLEYKNNLKISGKGQINNSGKKESIKYNIQKKKENINLNLKISFNETPIQFKLLNFYKNDKVKSELNINLIKAKTNLLLDKFSLISKKDQFIIEKLKLTDEFNILDFDNIKFNYEDKNGNTNDLNVTRIKKNYLINGNHFSLDSIIKDIITTDNRTESVLFNNKSRTFKIKFKENSIDNDHFIYDLKGDLVINNSKITKLNLNSKFNDKQKVFLTIVDKNGSQVTTFYSDIAKPFVKKFKFIKGFEEGKINYSSTKINKKSNSQLNIYDFKLKELPALTKLLTLASLQGIADVLTGEGVRFNEFEMIFSNKNQSMKIDEIYAIGPAISILMEGYIQRNELISLKGTLVPATTINKFVASIPILGDILVGKKTGEGVFGVSFKIKGPPGDLKTSVNPIKTLTPRFITRTLEKIKKTN